MILLFGVLCGILTGVVLRKEKLWLRILCVMILMGIIFIGMHAL